MTLIPFLGNLDSPLATSGVCVAIKLKAKKNELTDKHVDGQYFLHVSKSNSGDYSFRKISGIKDDKFRFLSYGHTHQ